MKPPKKGQNGDGPFVSSREVVLFRWFSLLLLDIAAVIYNPQITKNMSKKDSSVSHEPS